jgi:Sec-independent protein translocase protein TatA
LILQYDPKQLATVPRVLARFVGKEKGLAGTMRKKFEAEFTKNFEEEQDRLFQEQQQQSRQQLSTAAGPLLASSGSSDDEDGGVAASGRDADAQPRQRVASRLASEEIFAF